MEAEEKRVRAIWILTMAGGLAWLGAAIAAPWLRSRGFPLADMIYAVFRPVCHQLENRCFHLWGEPTAACARCLGIYAGFIAGTIIYPLARGFRKSVPPSPSAFVLFTLPIGVDFAGNFLGLWSTSDPGRFGVGWIWGLLLPFYLIAGLSPVRFSDLTNAVGIGVRSRRNGKREAPSPPPEAKSSRKGGINLH